MTGDGALGYPPGAPYHRVIVTAAVNRIPYPWVAQTRSGGRVLLPWADAYTGGLVALTVADDGTAHGTTVAESNFMWLREQRDTRGAVKPTPTTTRGTRPAPRPGSPRCTRTVSPARTAPG